LKFGEESDFKDLIAQAEPLDKSGITGRVYYVNLPKKFVAGTVYDPVEKEVVIGANCTLTDTATKKTYKAETDNFGDFWFKGLPNEARTYSLTIEKNGTKKALDNINAAQDVNLGDIAMRLV
jgi:tetrathionate reductase subunit B